MTSARTPPTSLQQWILLCATLWFNTGVFLDGWAHNHIPTLETFFTPWHAVFYSGYALSAMTLFGITLHNRTARKVSWSEAIPLGYGYALIGVIIFASGGIFDLAWHEIFGIEKDVEALLSPAHIFLAVGGFLINTANLRAWILDRTMISSAKLIDHIPMLFSATCGIALGNFMTQFSHRVVVRAGGDFPGKEMADVMQSAAVAGYIVETALLTAMLLFLARHRPLPFGSFMFIITLSTAAMGWMLDGIFFVPGALFTGLVADILGRKLFPFTEHVLSVRIFSFVVPTMLFLLYFITIALREGIWWSVHMWSGSIVFAGLSGLLLSFCFLAPENHSLRA